MDISSKNDSKRVQGIQILVLTLMTVGAAPSAIGYALRTTEAGDLVRWHQPDVLVTLDPSLQELGPTEDVERAIKLAFEQWVGRAGVDIEFEFVRAKCGKPGHTRDGENQNCVMVKNTAWDENDEDVGATTLVTYFPSSGEIIDADVVFNKSAGEWSTDGRLGTLDIRSVATHEVGHFLGLQHSEVEEATMYRTTRDNDLSKRDLHLDDIEASTELYEELAAEDMALSSCDGRNVAAGGTPSASALFVAALVLIFALRKIASIRGALAPTINNTSQQKPTASLGGRFNKK